MSVPSLAPGFICRPCRNRIARQSRRWASSEPRRRQTIPDGPVRTRFAPSPTGYLHFGSVRTALFNYLIARRTEGQFLLRIEDTDQKRTIPGAEQRILDDLRWLGLRWDEGPEVGGPYGPYRQSERSELYKEHSHQLIESGHAYRCFCSAETLQAKGQSRSQSGLTTLYDRTCYHMTPEESKARVANGEKFVVRLRAEDKPIAYTDIVGGPYELSRTAAQRAAAQGVYDDFILMKQDGLPTYHFANVVDDYHMKITHVIRGVEWQVSTPKHLSLYDAFRWTPPAFGHIGLLLNTDGTKMSKRDKTFDLHQFKEDGVLPEALINFLALHGWSHSNKSDYMTLKDLESTFDLNLSNTNPTVSLPKLWFLTPKHAMQRVVDGGSPYSEMVDMICTAVQTKIPELFPEQELLELAIAPHEHRAYIEQVLKADAKNYISAVEFVQSHSYFFLKHPKVIDEYELNQKHADIFRSKLTKKLLPLQKEGQEDWTHGAVAVAVEEGIKSILEWQQTKGSDNVTPFKTKDIWRALRAMLTGGEKGPSIIETIEILGPQVVLERMQAWHSTKAGPPPKWTMKYYDETKRENEKARLKQALREANKQTREAKAIAKGMENAGETLA